MGGGYGRFGERTCSFHLRQSFYKKGMALFGCKRPVAAFWRFLYVRETRDHMHWLVLDRDRLQALALWDGAVAEGRNPWRFFFGFALALSSFSEIRYRFFFGSVLDPLFRPGRLACGDFRSGQAVLCVPFLWFVRIASTMCIRGVPKVYHGGPAITVGVRREKTVGNRPGMRENRERASERAGNRLENGAAPWIPAGNGTGNRKSRTGITRYGSMLVWKSGKRREAGCPFTGRSSASQCSAIPPFPVLLYQTCLSGTITP